MTTQTLRDAGMSAAEVRNLVTNIKQIIGSDNEKAIQTLEDLRLFDPGQIDLFNESDITPAQLDDLQNNIQSADTFIERYTQAAAASGQDAAKASQDAAILWASIVRTVISEKERLEQIVSARDGERAFIRLSSELLGRAMDDFSDIVTSIQTIVEAELKKVNPQRFALWNGNPAKNLLLSHLSNVGQVACLEGTSFGRLTDGLQITNLQANHPSLDMSLWAALSRAYVRMAAEKISSSQGTIGFHVFVAHNGNPKGFTVNLEYPTLQSVFDKNFRLKFHSVAGQDDDNPKVKEKGGIFPGTVSSYEGRLEDFTAMYSMTRKEAQDFYTK